MITSPRNSSSRRAAKLSVFGLSGIALATLGTALVAAPAQASAPSLDGFYAEVCSDENTVSVTWNIGSDWTVADDYSNFAQIGSGVFLTTDGTKTISTAPTASIQKQPSGEYFVTYDNIPAGTDHIQTGITFRITESTADILGLEGAITVDCTPVVPETPEVPEIPTTPNTPPVVDTPSVPAAQAPVAAPVAPAPVLANTGVDVLGIGAGALAAGAVGAGVVAASRSKQSAQQ